MSRLILSSLAISASMAAALPLWAADSGAKPVDFSREILPILSDKCFVCHGPDGEEKEVLRLDSFAEATRDRDGNRAIDPDALEKSEILVRIHSADDAMPPEDAEKQLTDQERQLLSRWVRQGGKYATHWAFIRPKKQPPAGAADATKTQCKFSLSNLFAELDLSDPASH